jgi:transketolase
MITELVEHSFKNKLTHVPSALSMLTYINILFTQEYVKPYRDRIVLGKPFGSQAYYLVWKKLGYLDNIDNLSMGVKHEEISFVDYGEETMGNALGVAAGMAIANPTQIVWVNITDATLQMGSTLEALQYIGHNELNNILLTVDNNNCQVTGKTSDVLHVGPVLDFIHNNNWDVVTCDGHCGATIKDTYTQRSNFPRAFIYNTIKGYGVPYMECDPVKWHYRPIESL